LSGRRLAFATAAEGFAGAPFRFRGRDPQTGLDCVGLVTASLERLGISPPEIAPYAMRQRQFDAQLACAAGAGFDEAEGDPEPGDLLLLKPGPAQVHLAIVSRSGGLVHAHAGLGLVVVTPPPCSAAIERHWRLRED
jgi:cell wall-associated NlpC family hydrolase